MYRLRRNPNVELSSDEMRAYKRFHGHEPDYVDNRPSAWRPGPVYLVGTGVDIGYVQATENSNKDARYVHDFEKGVNCYARKGNGKKTPIEQVSGFPLKKFPSKLKVLGYCLGFTYKTENGKKVEKAAPVSWMLCTDFETRRTLSAISNQGVEYVFFGGKMYVDDWIYH